MIEYAQPVILNLLQGIIVRSMINPPATQNLRREEIGRKRGGRDRESVHT